MNLLTDLKPKEGSIHKKRRVGRGNGSGWGGTSGRGHKGQKARSGAPIRRGFEGGQTPMQIRLPKFGFTNNQFKKEYDIINIGQLEKCESQVTPESLKKMGLIHNQKAIKILAKGEVKKAFHVEAHKFSESAKKAIEAAGGSVKILEKPVPPKKKKRSKSAKAASKAAGSRKKKEVK